MSLRKGDRFKKGQKHKNVTAYKPGLHVKSKRIQEIAAVSLPGLCARCKEKIEWKKKYDKYKPLSAPKKCILCQRKAVKQAYYQICCECAESHKVCAKCGKKEDDLESFPPSKTEQAREEAEFQDGLKHMKERERRTFLREQFGSGTKKKRTATIITTTTEDKSPDPLTACTNDQDKGDQSLDSDQGSSDDGESPGSDPPIEDEMEDRSTCRTDHDLNTCVSPIQSGPSMEPS